MGVRGRRHGGVALDHIVRRRLGGELQRVHRCCLSGVPCWRGAPGDTYVNRPTVTGRGSTHIDTAFMGLTSSGGVTVNCKLQARASSRPILSRPRDHDSKRARAVACLAAITAGSRLSCSHAGRGPHPVRPAGCGARHGRAGAGGPGRRGARQGVRDDGEPHGLRLPGRQPFFARPFTGLSRPRVTILGTSSPGEVEAVGPAVTHVRRR